MATAKVIAPFRDKNDNLRLYQAGASYEGSAERIAELASKGFVMPEKVEQDKAEEQKAEEPKAEKPKAAPKRRSRTKKQV